jgi:hypothetical protein
MHMVLTLMAGSTFLKWAIIQVFPKRTQRQWYKMQEIMIKSKQAIKVYPILMIPYHPFAVDMYSFIELTYYHWISS